MRNYYRNVRDKLMKEIKNSRLADISIISEEGSGLHFLLKIQTELSDTEYIEICRKNKINVSCLSQYYNEDRDSNSIIDRQHTIIMNYSGIRLEDVGRTVELLWKSLNLKQNIVR